MGDILASRAWDDALQFLEEQGVNHSGLSRAWDDVVATVPEVERVHSGLAGVGRWNAKGIAAIQEKILGSRAWDDD